MRIVVTGSESFIGKELRKHCRSEGLQIVTIDVAPSNESGHVQLDIRSPNVEEEIPLGADALIHLAAVSTDSACRRDIKNAFDVNVGGTLSLIKAAEARRVKQFVFASSEWVYGGVETGDVQTEESPIDLARVLSEYALTKIVAERLLYMAHKQGSFSVTVLRFGIVYGPRPANWSAVEQLFHAVQTNATVEVKGSLKTARRFIHVSDIADGILRAVGQEGYEVFNLTGDVLITLGDIIDQSAKLLGRCPRVIEAAPLAVNIRNPDNTKARHLLGWVPEIGLKQGLLTLLTPG